MWNIGVILRYSMWHKGWLKYKWDRKKCETKYIMWEDGHHVLNATTGLEAAGNL